MPNSPSELARILIIEDDAVLAMMLQGELQSAGFHVAGPAFSLAGALHLIEKVHIDAALLDIEPRGDLAMSVDAALRNRAIPYAVMSSYGRERVANLLGSATPYLQKPVQVPDLLSVVRALLAAPRSGRQP